MFKEFPHIKRKLPAVILVVILTLLSFINLAQNKLFRPSEEKNLHGLILQNPGISNLHERLGQYYLGVDDKGAEREYLLAQEYYKPSSLPDGNQVLGSESSPWQTWLNLKAKKDSLAGETKNWEKVTEVYPEYLYAYLKLAVLNLQKGETKKAQNYIDITLRNDPSNQEALILSSYTK